MAFSSVAQISTSFVSGSIAFLILHMQSVRQHFTLVLHASVQLSTESKMVEDYGFK